MSRKNFKWYYKKDYKWNKILYKKGIRGVYQGENNNSNEGVISKLIKIDKENNKPKFEDLLKEVYFLAAFKKNDYFNEIIDVFLSQNDENFFPSSFLIFALIKLRNLTDKKERI